MVFERFTWPARRAIALAQDEAMAFGHDFMSTEHLLLGLIGAPGAAGEVLRAQGVGLQPARDEVLRLLAEAGVPRTAGQSAKDALSSIGIDVDQIREQADTSFGPGKFRFPRPAFTVRLKQTVARSLGEARAHGQEHIGTEHLLLALLREEQDEGQGHGTQVLIALHADLDELRTAVLARLAA